MGRIEARPTAGLCYEPSEPKYFERAGFEKELERIFDICHGCRLCFNLCPAFPALFEAVDAKGGDVRTLSSGEKSRVVELCYGCKLCEVRCPYTPRDKHVFQVDFPRLMTRAKAIEAREQGVALRDRLLGKADLIGKLGGLAPGLANRGSRGRLGRQAMELLLGIHREKRLPEFAAETFERWLERNPLPPDPSEPAAKVALFPTCFVNYYKPAVGKAAVAVLARNRCALRYAKVNCCGMPALDSGDVAFAQGLARANIAALLPLVNQGFRVVPINPTCSLMMRREYPGLVGGEDAARLARAVADPHELLLGLKRANKFDAGFRSTPGAVAYHIPCHLKAQGIGFPSRDLMRAIPGTRIVTIDACSAHDGTWAMKKEFFEISMKWGEKAFGAIRDAAANVVATDCSLAALQFEQATGTRPLHPLEVLARAYEADGFPQAVEPTEGAR